MYLYMCVCICRDAYKYTYAEVRGQWQSLLHLLSTLLFWAKVFMESKLINYVRLTSQSVSWTFLSLSLKLKECRCALAQTFTCSQVFELVFSCLHDKHFTDWVSKLIVFSVMSSSPLKHNTFFPWWDDYFLSLTSSTLNLGTSKR